MIKIEIYPMEIRALGSEFLGLKFPAIICRYHIENIFELIMLFFSK